MISTPVVTRLNDSEYTKIIIPITTESTCLYKMWTEDKSAFVYSPTREGSVQATIPANSSFTVRSDPTGGYILYAKSITGRPNLVVQMIEQVVSEGTMTAPVMVSLLDGHLGGTSWRTGGAAADTGNTTFSGDNITVPGTVTVGAGQKDLNVLWAWAESQGMTSHGADTETPSLVITTATGQMVSADSLDIAGTVSDNTAVISLAWRVGSGTENNISVASNWSAIVSGMSNGSNTITVTAKDAAGNTSTQTISVTYNAPADSENPIVAIATASQTITTDSLNIQGTASDNIGVSSLTYRFGVGAEQNISVGTNWSASVSGFTTGGNTITVTASDASGNTASDTVEVTYYPDAGTYYDATKPVSTSVTIGSTDLGAKMKMAYIFNSGTGTAVKDYAGSNDGAISGPSMTWVADGIRMGATADVITPSAPMNLNADDATNNPNGIGFTFRCKQLAEGSNGMVFGNNSVYFYLSDGRVRFASADYPKVGAGSTQWVTYTGSRSPNQSWQFYIDGVLQSPNAYGFDVTCNDIGSGYRADHSSHGFIGDFEYFYMHDALTPAEVANILAHPYSMFKD